jgi:hypothetical protein
MAPPTPARKPVKPKNPYLAETKRKKQQKIDADELWSNDYT